MKDYRRIAEDFATHLKTKYDDRIERIILFGSVARGEYREDSDIDLLVVTTESTLDLQWDVAADSMDLLLREGVLATALVVTSGEWGTGADSAFRRRVRTEGFVVA